MRMRDVGLISVPALPVDGCTKSPTNKQHAAPDIREIFLSCTTTPDEMNVTFLPQRNACIIEADK